MKGTKEGEVPGAQGDRRLLRRATHQAGKPGTGRKKERELTQTKIKVGVYTEDAGEREESSRLQ